MNQMEAPGLNLELEQGLSDSTTALKGNRHPTAELRNNAVMRASLADHAGRVYPGGSS
jgi:hypothetical protein